MNLLQKTLHFGLQFRVFETKVLELLAHMNDYWKDGKEHLK